MTETVLGDVVIVPPRGALVVGCISAVFEYAVYDRETEKMLGYAEGQSPRVGELLDVTHDARGLKHGTPFAVVVTELDEKAWD